VGAESGIALFHDHEVTDWALQGIEWVSEAG
jgi:hypothetical protein